MKDFRQIEVEIEEGWGPLQIAQAITKVPSRARLYALYPGAGNVKAAIVFRMEQEERT